MPAAKFFARLDLDPICLFLDEHYLTEGPRSFFMFTRCMNNRPRKLHKLMPKGS
jgi:hypothetical protein